MGTTRLYSTISVEEQWQSVAGPWLRAQAGTAWRNARPTVILTPSRAESFYLRGRLVAEGMPYLGLHFWTPSDARKFLLAELAPEIAPATQAELRLLVRACAEKLASEDPDNATLTSVIREPGAFLRAYDLLLSAGWEPARDGADYGLDLAYVLQTVFDKSRIATQAGIHRQLRRAISWARQRESLLSNLLVVGFSATHWPLWDLLQAVVSSADDATVGLLEPHIFGEDLDQLWNSSWEEVAASEVQYPPSPVTGSEAVAPFSALAVSYEEGTPADSSGADLAFLVTPDLTSHIRAIALQTLNYLGSDSCTRLGIVFAEANALALGVAQELRRLGLPIDDGTGAFLPGIFEQRCWQAWLALQEEPGGPKLIAWLRACEAGRVASGIPEGLAAHDVAQVLESALGETLVDDLDFLALHLVESNTRGSDLVADFLRHRLALPVEATFSRFLAQTREAMALPGWENHLARLRIDPPAWLRDSEEIISRPTFLAWLKDSTAAQTRTRSAESNHFYGRIHLTIYAQMTGQTWSHLILTGLNEGVWPRAHESGAFGSRHELAELNRQARALNVRGTEQGGQGMGHDIVRAAHGHCLLPIERQDLALRDLCAVLESTREAVSLAAMTTEGGRSLLPNDFFSHAYQAKTGAVLDEEIFRRLAHATEAWCRRHGPALPRAASDGDAMLEDLPLFAQPVQLGTRTAYVARRNASAPFGRYEFAYAETPREPIQLSCKRWDDAWHHPATVWLEDIVGAPAWPEGTLSWQRAVGTWVHRWLASALREWRQVGAPATELPRLIHAAASREAMAVRRRARQIDFELYPWWEQVWAQARAVALGLGETLAPILPDRAFVCEFRIPPEVMIALPGTVEADFALKGRIDLLLVEPGVAAPDLAHGDLTGCSCWIVDFKTGGADKLTPGKIAKGKGLQAVLYALAARARGAAAAAISVHTPDEPLKPQVQLDAVLDLAPLFRSLDIFHRRGVFGMRPDAANAYGYLPAYPMATRMIPGNILEAKWALVHGVEPVAAPEAE